MTFIVGIFLGVLALVSIVIKRAYESTSVKELKKRARAGDTTAELLHRSVSYGVSLNFILWVLVCLLNAIFFVYVARSTEPWFATIIAALIIWLGFIWLPKRRASSLGIWVAAKISPVVSRVASFIHPVISKLNAIVRSYIPLHVHTGLYDEDDLIKLLNKQKQQVDNQISHSALEIAIHALGYADVLVRDVLIPRRAVKMVHEEDTTGPVLLDELHASGFSRFPVYGEEKDKITGILYLRDLVNSKATTKVKVQMKKEVLYIHEEQTLREALSAVMSTHQHLFVVVNSFEEYVGIITSEDILEQILGEQLIDESDKYEDIRAVAAREAAIDHQNLEHPLE